MNQVKNTSRGFTIVEITVSMAFISVLLLALVFVGMHLAALYNKGITIRDVNTAARQVVRGLQDDIGGASSRPSIVYADKAADGSKKSTYKIAKTLSEASANGVHYYNNDDGGRLCTGTYTYVWNYRKAFISANKQSGGGMYSGQSHSVSSLARVQYIEQTVNGVTIARPVRFVKITDPSRELCRKGSLDTSVRIPVKYGNQSFSVLGEGERGLVLYNFRITSPEYGDSSSVSEGAGASVGNDVIAQLYSSFYTVNMTIGSSLFDDQYIGSQDDKLVGLDRTGVACAVGGAKNDIYAEYCAINNIEFVVRTGAFR